MILLAYILPVAAWLAFIYVQHQFGDRPTTYVWWALMSGLGVFEYGKCVFSYFEGLPAASLAFLLALGTTGAVLAYHAHKTWAPAQEAPEEGVVAAG